MWWILRLVNLLNSSPTGRSNHSLSAKKTKRGRRKLISHLELFQQVEFVVNFYIYMTCRLQKPRRPLQVSLVYICVYQSGGKTLAILQQILHWSSKIRMFQNQIGSFQNISKRILKNNWMFEYVKFSNY